MGGIILNEDPDIEREYAEGTSGPHRHARASCRGTRQL